jgi:hypothetical protein
MLLKVLAIILVAYLGGSFAAQLVSRVHVRCRYCRGRLVPTCNGAGRVCEQCMRREG